MLRGTMRLSILITLLFFIPGGMIAQIKQPVKWNFSAVQVNDQEAEITFAASIEDEWHIYSQYMEGGGPVATKFTFIASNDYTLVDQVQENSEPLEKFDPTFSMPVVWFEKSAIFTRRIKTDQPLVIVKGSVLFMACSGMECLVPQEVEFSIEVKMRKPENEKQSGKLQMSTGKAEAKTVEQEELIKTTEKQVETSETDTTVYARSSGNSKSIATSDRADHNVDLPEQTLAQHSAWSVFILGFLGGFVALLMPCIFPMIPFTVGYFLKRGGSRKNQICIASLYGFSIIVIYVVLGLFVTILFGADALNALSTNGVFNFAFFLLLVIFAVSFLGGFELRLPSTWINKADAQSDRKGFAGIFFMAATLALVSFSCTGPIIGTLLVGFSRSDGLLIPVMGMLGFSLALALPFTLFATFPSLLKGLPKSGGWLNSVKVVLGFLELALALKFLSNVDLAYHWEWFDREVFLVLWIIIFGLMGFYLLGKIKLPHDTELKFISPVRLFFAIVSLAFTLYMIPGLWGAPLKVIAAFLPPQSTQDFDLHSASLFPVSFTKNEYRSDKKYGDLFEAPHGLDAFFDFDEGIAYARKVNKPVMIDFTGHACVNCRKMEMNVWSDQKVLEKLRHDFVLIQLYVDDKTPLPEHEQVTSVFSGKKIETIGNKWSDLQAASFNTNSQPYYVLLSSTGKQLVTPQGADYDADRFSEFLMKGIKAFETSEHIN